MQKLVPDFLCYLVRPFYRQTWRDGYVHLGVKAVAQPSYSHLGHAAYVRCMVDGVPDLIDHLWVYRPAGE